MEYKGLTDIDRWSIRAQHTLELEAERYRLCLREEEEPGASRQRTATMAVLADRIARQRAILNGDVDADHTEESPEHGAGDPPQ